MDIKSAIDHLKDRSKNSLVATAIDVRVVKLAIEALEKQALFENEVSNISNWFVDNKDCLLDAAQKVARDGFIESCVDEFIDEVDLDFIVVDIVDEVQKGILNVLDTFRNEKSENQMTRLENIISKLNDGDVDIFKLMDSACPEEYFKDTSCEYDGIKKMEDVTDMDCLKCWLKKSSK